jgi:hypothetical protein
MNVVTALPESMASGYTGILVIVDLLSNMTIYLACRKDIDTPELARMLFENVICKRGLPDNITTDWCIEFNSRIGREFVPTSLSITASRPPSTHGQTVNRTCRTKQLSSSSEPFATTCRTTGLNCYHWQSLLTTTPSTNPDR